MHESQPASSKMNMRTFPLMPEEGDGGSKTCGHLVGKKPFILLDQL